jgi:hypothetical protein
MPIQGKESVVMPSIFFGIIIFLASFLIIYVILKISNLPSRAAMNTSLIITIILLLSIKIYQMLKD